MTLTLLSENKVFGGLHRRYSHESSACSCTMTFAVFVPPQAIEDSQEVPVFYWLSGLTCTDENFMQKAGAFRVAAELGIAIVAPDTSPRGEGIADAPDGAYDLGLGAGFYVNATEHPWDTHYQMYSYVVEELPQLVKKCVPFSGVASIAGHSMGGHGALTIALKNPTQYSAVSSFAAIAHPTNCPWGKKAFSHYLGGDTEKWKSYDALELVNQLKTNAPMPPILLHQGTNDEFLEDQLMPESLLDAFDRKNIPVLFKSVEGYDHSYFFIASFIEEHLRFHALTY